METFKQVLAFPLYATVAWLAWVLGAQAGNDAVLGLLAGLVLIAMARVDVRPLGAFARAVARGGRVDPRGGGRRGRVARPRGAWRLPRRRWRARASCRGRSGHRKKWRRSPARASAVFVDFTAAWCVTCQVNKRVALHDAAVVNAFAAHGVVPLSADWTRQDPRITAALAALGRNAVPVYALYLPGEPDAAPAARSADARPGAGRTFPRRPRPKGRDLHHATLTRKEIPMKLLALALACALPAAAFANASVGKPAPGFTVNDLSGKPVNLADYKGKTVVLEWHNFGCPFVQKHYRSGNMQALQKKYASDVVWLAVNSTNKSASDYTAPAKLTDAAEGLRRGARALPDGRARHHGHGLRRQDHAAHVHHRSERQGGLQRRDRRQALDRRRRREDREELRGRGARGAQGRQGGHHRVAPRPTAARSSTARSSSP